ncbi:COP23 domain-containing protein [Leptolyngbya sp. FACHB-711]|uniref:COP23 domain-containing protein n=1 Tax=unclassified Leptolyngbya TaxID=2650499 RepID=UPI0016874A2A|nr:COP23 domain-containing protein [Leptolyngbya sp. FACHB-711]MBD1852512.1 hypothetical protein [Cyanobacteria bacterium FACHB-502]MBD2027921.1 hypothetical protein [Leptolyngbya sp. FACHB-711]
MPGVWFNPKRRHFVQTVCISTIAVLSGYGSVPAQAESVQPDRLLVAQIQSAPPTTSPSPTTTPTTDTRFTCQMMNGQYTVMYNPQSQPGEAYPWAAPGQMGGGWSADRRCQEISRRLEFYRPDGLLELQTAVENGYNTVCVTTEQVPGCRIVLTVPEGQDPISTRDRVFANLSTADGGQNTAAVSTYRGDGAGSLLNQIGQAVGLDLSSLTGTGTRTRSSSRSGINLRPFLDPADGGTGTRLR